MVAAKLDQIRVLVTKFRQNRFTLKAITAGQRHTDRQMQVKIRALQFAIGPTAEDRKERQKQELEVIACFSADYLNE